MDFKEAGDLIYVVGMTYDELGGSYYYKTRGVLGNSVPTVDAKRSRTLMERLSRAIKSGLVNACHDCSEGGIGVAAAEMAFAGGFGAEIKLEKVPFKAKYDTRGKRRDDLILFSESNTRFIVGVSPEKQKGFEKAMKGAALGLIGGVLDDKYFAVYGLGGGIVVRTDHKELKEAWQAPLRW